MTDEDTLALADRLFGAIEAGDLDAVSACYADDIVVWANFDDRDQDKAALAAGARLAVRQARRTAATRCAAGR